MNGEIGGSAGLTVLSTHLIEGNVVPGEFGVFYPDHIMGHDVTAPPALEMLDKAGIPYLRAAKKTTLYLDHFTPPKDTESAETCRSMIEFMHRYGAKRIVGWGEGICHVDMFEGGKVKAGELVLGADSHITTGGALGAYCMACGSTDLAMAMASGEFWLQVPEPLGVVLEGIPDVWCEGKDIALKMLSALGPSGGSGKLLEIGGNIVKWLGTDGRLTIANMASESSCASAMIEQGIEHGQ